MARRKVKNGQKSSSRPEICLLFAGCTCLRSPEKRKKKNACCAGYHSRAEIKGGIYEKQKTKKAHRQDEKVLSVKKQNVF